MMKLDYRESTLEEAGKKYIVPIGIMPCNDSGDGRHHLFN